MREEKQVLLDEIKKHIDRFPSFVILRYQGLPANTVNDFRREIANFGGNVEFVKKRVMAKAAEAAGVKVDLETLPGHIGLVFADKEPFEVAKYVFKFSKDNESAVQVLGGRFEGKLYDGSQVEMLSSLPSKDEMRAQLLGTFEAPMAQTLAVMEALIASVVYCLDNKAKQQEGS